MNESKKSLNNEELGEAGPDNTLLRIPKATGTAWLFIAAGLFLLYIGLSSQESAALLLGAILLFTFSISFLGVFALSLLRRKDTTLLSVQFVPCEAKPDTKIDIIISPPFSRIHFPWLLTRYEIPLYTKDGRTVHHIVDPYELQKNERSFVISERGAYFGIEDFLTSYDIFGLFTVSYPIQAEKNARILILPEMLQEAVPVSLKSGGSAHRQEAHYHKTDDLTDNRPYIPGDDPRRINWKLFGHSGSLFIREGEPEPPPESQYTIILDTSYDLHSQKEACKAVDGLCETALYILSDLHNKGISVGIGFNKSECKLCTPHEAVQFLSYPAAIPALEYAPLPALQEQKQLLILALPGSIQSKANLELYLKRLSGKQGHGIKADIWFLYNEARFGEAASECARLFSGKGGIHARSVRI